MGNGRWRPPGESFCSPINYSRPVDVDLVGTRILITSCPFFAAEGRLLLPSRGDAKLIGSRLAKREETRGDRRVNPSWIAITVGQPRA